MTDAAPPPPGTIVLLNGVSSAGKTTLARALREVLPGRWAYIDLDAFERMAPPFDGADAAMPFYEACLLPAMHRCVAAFAAAGANVVVDTVLFTPRQAADAGRQLARFRVVYVGVRCALPELRRRERAREDRRIGQAESQLAPVHAHGPYDLEVDTTAATPEAGALEIKRYLESGHQPAAFRRLGAAPTDR